MTATDRTVVANGPTRPAIAGSALTIASYLPVLVIVSLAPAVPVMIRHFSNLPHASVLVPLLVTTPGLVVALLGSLAGLLVDRAGRRKPLLIATALYAVAGMAPLVVTSFAAIVAARAVVGGCEAVIVVCVNALLADYFDPARRRFWLAAQGIASPILSAGVAALAGGLTTWQWNGAFLTYALVVPIAICILIFCPEPAAHVPVARRTERADRVSFPVRESVVIGAVTVFSCALFYIYVIQAGLAFEAVGVRSSASIGQYIGLAALVAPLGAILFTRLSRRYPAEWTLAISITLMAVGLVVIGIARTPSVVILGALLHQTSAGMLLIGQIYWVSTVYRPQHRGLAFGLWSSASFISQFLSPLLFAGARAVSGGVLPAFLILGLVGLVGAVVLALAGRTPLASLDEEAPKAP